MQMKKRLWIIIFVLAAVSLACNLSIFSPKTPAPPIPVTTEAVQSLEETAQNAYNDFQQSGTVKLTITEAQLTSLVATKLAESGDQTITDPQVYLRDGKILVYGTVKTDNLEAKAEVIMSVVLDSSGQPSFKIESAKLGPFPLPQNLISQLETRLNLIFRQEIASLAPNTVIDSIQIADGQMVIEGHQQ
jgi:uncharacterized protein YpmS